MRIAQLSDPHLTADARPLYGVVDTEMAFGHALQRLARLDPAPDLLLLSGDLVNGGADFGYHRLRRRVLATGLRHAVMPGNHDRREALRAVFPEQAWSGDPLACQRLDVAGATLLLLDSTLPGEEGGEIGAVQIAWLQAVCPPERPVLLALHHPPFDIGIAGMDAIRCRGEQRLAAWLATRPQVEALLCGHVHRFVVTTFGGRPALTAPSTAHQIALQGGPLAYTLEGGGFLVHDWQPGVRLLTHYVPVAAAPVHVYTD